MKIQVVVRFIGKFHKRNSYLPPMAHRLTKGFRKKDTIRFLKLIEKKYPAALSELIRIENDGDESTASDESGSHHPREREMKASITVHKRAEGERMFQ